MAAFTDSVEHVVAHIASLVVRASANGLPGGKTLQEYQTEGRYNYPPSFAAAVIFVVLFGIAAAVNLFQLFRHRAWFWWVMNFAVISKYPLAACNLRSVSCVV